MTIKHRLLLGMGMGIMLLLVSCNSNSRTIINREEKKCVQKVLTIDDSLGKIRNHETEKISLSRAIENYTNELRKISFEKCPGDFKSAFDDHIQAWKNITRITDKYSTKRGEMHVLLDEIEQSKDSVQFNKLMQEIWNTWKEIENSIEKRRS